MIAGKYTMLARTCKSAMRRPDPLQPLAFVIGQWEGASNGQPGVARVRREYTRILNRRGRYATARGAPRSR
jgi:hypothetical protein